MNLVRLIDYAFRLLVVSLTAAAVYGLFLEGTDGYASGGVDQLQNTPGERDTPTTNTAAASESADEHQDMSLLWER